MSERITELKQRVIDAEQKVAYLESLLNSFWTGDVPDKATLSHMILAHYGRERLAKKSKQAALLVKQETPLDKTLF